MHEMGTTILVASSLEDTKTFHGSRMPSASSISSNDAMRRGRGRFQLIWAVLKHCLAPNYGAAIFGSIFGAISSLLPPPRRITLEAISIHIPCNRNNDWFLSLPSCLRYIICPFLWNNKNVWIAIRTLRYSITKSSPSASLKSSNQYFLSDHRLLSSPSLLQI